MSSPDDIAPSPAGPEGPSATPEASPSAPPQSLGKPDSLWHRLVDLRWVSLLACCLLVAAFAVLGFPQLRFDVSNEALFVEGDPVLERFHELEATFGSDEVLFCLFEVEDAFEPATRDRLIALGADDPRGPQ